MGGSLAPLPPVDDRRRLRGWVVSREPFPGRAKCCAIGTPRASAIDHHVSVGRRTSPRASFPMSPWVLPSRRAKAVLGQSLLAAHVANAACHPTFPSARDSRLRTILAAEKVLARLFMG